VVYTGSPPLDPWDTDDWQWFHDHRAVLNEADWLACPDPGPIIDFLNQGDAVPARKFFLAGAGCVRRVWHLLELPQSRAAVEAAERFADGHVTREALRAESDSAHDASRTWAQSDPRFRAALASSQLRHDPRGNHGNAEHTLYCYCDVAWAVALASGTTEHTEAFQAARLVEFRQLATLYRCVFGNPFRPVAFDPAWRTDTAVSLARGMYESRDFSAMPILADALQDAGCEDEQVLHHCHDATAPHVRGCWVCDLVLSKQ
jgi:hypothetical protein